MVIAILTVLGLAWGSFVNALVWRLRQQAQASKKLKVSKVESNSGSRLFTFNFLNSTSQNDYSILAGRSMCPNCRHTLSAGDLIPLVSWLILRGKCRYCSKPISAQYPLVEALTALIFVLSYIFWPLTLASGPGLAVFGLWLVLVIILVALAIYDLRWQLLPDKLVLALAVVAIAQTAVVIASAGSPLDSLINHIIGLAIGGGIFYLIFLISNGKWIGGGDVKLGFVIGLIAATPAKSLLMLFLAALAGTLTSLPLIAGKRLKRTSTIPFGPFLILATVIVVLFGQRIIDWYLNVIKLG